MTVIKTEREIQIMQESGAILSRILDEIGLLVRVNQTPKDLDKKARKLFRKYGVKPAFLGYRGFPASICVSVNSVVVHGIPGHKPFEKGDIVSVDLGCVYKGYCADMAKTFQCGTISKDAERLLQVTKQALHIGIEHAKAGKHTGDLGHAIQNYVESHGFSVVRDLVGHGVGRYLHEDPQIPNFGKAQEGEKLVPGMTIAIEPMVNIGSPDVLWENDGWTVRTKDGTLSAHFEHTIAITQNGAKVLTKYE